MSKSLYEEAIAEARQLREVAEKNAKAALVEAVTPKIRQFIEDQLVRDHTDMSDKDILEEVASEAIGNSNSDSVTLDESAIYSLMSLLGGSKEISDSMAKTMKDALSESVDDLSNEERQKLVSITRKLERQDGILPSSGIVMNRNNTPTIEESQNMARTNETLYEVDINSLMTTLSEGKHKKEEPDAKEDPVDENSAIIAQMLAELDDDKDEMYDPLSEYDLLEQEEDLMDEPLDEPVGDLPADEPAGGEADADVVAAAETIEAGLDDLLAALGMEGGEELPMGEELPPLEELPPDEGGDEEPLAEVLDVDINMLRSEIKRMRRLAEEAAPGAGSTDPKAKDYGGGKVERELFVDSEDKHLNVQAENRKLRNAYTKQGRTNRSLAAKLDEYRSAVHSLREQLTEMNLFNAKLLYVNKLMQNGEVSSAQRRSIIEALDSAKSLREVKLLYKTLTESIGNRKKGRTLTESAVRRNLGSASRTTTRSSTPHSGAAELDRWAKLAGINK